MEHASGNAAEGNALQTVLFCQIKAGTVALSQLLFLFLGGNAVGNNRANGVDDMTGWQVVAFRDEGIAGSQQPSLHLVGTLLAKLDAGGGVDAVVYAVVERCPAAQCLSVGSIDDGFHLQTGDVALPEKDV